MQNWKREKSIFQLFSALNIILVLLFVALGQYLSSIVTTVFVVAFITINLFCINLVTKALAPAPIDDDQREQHQSNNGDESGLQGASSDLLQNRVHLTTDIANSFSEMNEALIGSYSMTGIIKSSLEKLDNAASYRMMMFTQFDGEFLHVRDKAGDQYHLITEPEYPVDSLEEEALFNSTLQAIETQHWQTDSDFDLSDKIPIRNRADDYSLYASIALPLSENIFDAEFSILTLWTENENGFTAEEIKELDLTAKEIAKALSVFKQRKMRQLLESEKVINYQEVLLHYVDIIEKQDVYIAGHSLRVAQYSKAIAEQMGFSRHETLQLEQAAILHDVGKIATPDTILLKPGRLSVLEYERIKQHVLTSYSMLSKVAELSEVAEIVKLHHEHFDGSGYPYGLAGDDIPLSAHILMLTDAYDAMTAPSLYKQRISKEAALQEIISLSGSQFHPDVVTAAVEAFGKLDSKLLTIDDHEGLRNLRKEYFPNSEQGN